MSKIENFIREHRSEFDDAEPNDGHFDRFASRLDEEPIVRQSTRNRSQVLKIAALILFLITLSAVVFDFARQQISEVFVSENSSSVISEEMQDALHYYSSNTSDQLEIIGSLTNGKLDAGAIKGSVQDELKNLDASTAELEIALKDHPGNERIQAAIIQNQQMKNVILTNVINRLSDKSDH